jgi:aspartyl/asparaginyl-tRNA synthetase
MDFENTIRAILEKQDEFYRIESDRLREVIDILKVENARLREALEYYADKAWINIKMPYLTEVDFDDVSKPFPDQKPMGGRRAREALKGGE